MKTKITLFLTFNFLIFLCSGLNAQTVSGISSNTGCQNSGIITSSTTGLGATPQYQLLRAGIAVSPVPGDNTQFTSDPVFTGLSSGAYVVNARATSVGPVFSSSNIIVTDGYTAMAVVTPTKVANCVGGTAALTSTITNGKSPFTYSIATQISPGVILQNSGSVNSNTFTFNALAANSYIISVTDACGQTITGATSISNPTIGLADIKLGSIAFPMFNTLFDCSSPLAIRNELLFQYVANSTTISASDAANFTWKIKYYGQLYGKDINADGYSDIGGDGYSPLTGTIRMPLIADKDGILADISNMRAVLIDNCGNTKEFPITQYGGNMGAYNCGGTGMIRATSNRLGCYPLELTFTNIANPADVVSKTMTKTVEVISDLTPGATYHVTYIDDEGYTTGNFGGLPANQNIAIPTVASMSIAQNTAVVQQNLNVLGFGRLFISVNPFKPDDVLSYTVITSDNPVVPVGYTGSVLLDSSGYAYIPRVNATDPVGYWPMGNYTITMTTPCGSRTINAVVKGYAASLSGNTLTSVCGGFNYVMNGTFDIASAYQVVIVSGPSSVGQVRDLANTTASLPFNGLSYGTYVFGLRIKGGTQNVLTQTVTYNANNAIIVDKTNTGGFVCAAGAVNGVLTITAQSNSPAPGNILEYALSTDGGVNYSSYQSGNTFSGLTNDTYFFRIKDGCGNVITQSVQIGVAAAPDATANGMASPATLCAANTGNVQLDIDISGALSYLWTGPGINSSNETLKSPVINYTDLITGANNFTCSVTLDAPCSSTTVSSLIINVNPQPTITITNPVQTCSPNTIDITASLITAGSDPDLTYTYFSDDAATIPVADPAAVTVGDTYYIKGTNTNGCTAIVPVIVTINDLPLAVISYLNAPYCQTGTAVADELGTAGGTYSSDANLSINPSTGEIDLEASTIGDHIITYLFSDGSCSNTFETTITINPLPVASISYPNASYCNRGSATVVQTGIAGGDYTSDPGLVINETTGEIDLASSTPGTYIVNYDFNDGTCSNNTTTSIIINNTTLPAPIANFTAECSASPAAPTLTDSCAGLITGETTTTFPISTQGTTVVTWTFDYGNSYTQSVNQNVIIDDVTPPVVPVLTDLTAECSLTPPIPTTTDACAGIITGTTSTVFPISTQGTTVIVWSFDDGNGNISTANQNIIIDDVTPPVVPILTDLTAECSLTPPIPTTTDACAGVITGTSNVVFPISTQGTTIIVWSFDDGNGNISTANQNIIIDDITPPVVPILTDLTAECSLTPPIPTTTDACAGIITGTTNTVFPVETQGTTIIVWSFDDGNGNISTANQNVIIDDVTPPVVPILTDLTAECSLTPPITTTTDACAGIITGTTNTVFPVETQGTTIIVWSFDDGNGNISTANQNVIIDDVTPPVVPILTDLTAECSLTSPIPTTTDACAGIITGTTNTVFPVETQGTTVIVWSFDDGNGNISTANQNIIIDDVTPPLVPVLNDLTAECSLTPSIPTTTDACGGSITGTTNTVFPIETQGTTIIVWSFDDGNGNISTANQNVIIDDVTPPVVPILTDLTAECSLTPPIPTTTDVCAGIITGTSNVVFPISTQGTTVIVWSFDDGNGNISTANQNIIIDDVTPPAVPVLTDLTAECSLTPPIPTTTDACAGSITGTTNTVFPIETQGTTIIVWSFDDGNGNISTANQNIIIDDVTPPLVPTLPDLTAECSLIPPIPTTTDACEGIITGTTNTFFPISTQGTTVIVWSFDDGNGNISTANQNIIIDDVTPPVIPVLTDLNAECSLTPPIPTTTDACAGIITGTTSTVFPISTQGTTLIVWSFDDGNGNISTANQNIIIDDVTPPVIPILSDLTAECSLIPPIPTTTDACAGSITGTTNTIFPISTQGTTVIVWSFDDGNGNISTANQNIIIDDVTPPLVPVLTDLTSECSLTPPIPTTTDACAGIITGTTNTVFPISTQGTTVIVWSFDDGNGNISTANQNIIIDDVTPPVVPVLADITGECTVTPTPPTTTDACDGIITGTTTTTFPITAVGTTIIAWSFSDGQGNVSTANQNVVISQIALMGNEVATCSTSEAGYNITLSVSGQAPYTVIGIGAPGVWSGNNWTSGLIASGVDYSITLQDVNACNSVMVSGISPNCCSFNVVCPTFQNSTVSCYDELPSAVSLTEAQFEALGNGDGRIADTYCGVIEITASNGVYSGCNENVARIYTITEYDDLNHNGVRDNGENTVLNTAACTETILVNDTIAPVFVETLPPVSINTDCSNIPPEQNFTATDNCSAASVTYSETRVDGDCSSRYSLIRTWTASDDCNNQNTFTQTINVSCVEEVYNAVSANGDGINDTFFIKGIDCYSNNTLKIYNRYGVTIYEKTGYDNVTNPFQGFSDGRGTVGKGNKLPTGTYFYTLEYDDAGRKIAKSGYLYVSSQ